jgi:hypothetical protein
MKICVKCNIEKSLENFRYRKDTNRYEGICNECNKKQKKEYYLNNREKIMNKSNLYYKENTEKVLIKRKKYVEDNFELIKKRKSDYHIKNAEKIRKKVKLWRLENKEKRNQTEKDKRKNDSLYKIIHYLRVRTNFFLKKMNVKKKNSFSHIIGCEPDFLKEHIEKKFVDGMSWDKMGKYIHIDHIIPLSSAKTKDEIYKLCHYSNLQPLWAKDNLKKSNKII